MSFDLKFWSIWSECHSIFWGCNKIMRTVDSYLDEENKNCADESNSSFQFRFRSNYRGLWGGMRGYWIARVSCHTSCTGRFCCDWCFVVTGFGCDWCCCYWRWRRYGIRTWWLSETITGNTSVTYFSSNYRIFTQKVVNNFLFGFNDIKIWQNYFDILKVPCKLPARENAGYRGHKIRVIKTNSFLSLTNTTCSVTWSIMNFRLFWSTGIRALLYILSRRIWLVEPDFYSETTWWCSAWCPWSPHGTLNIAIFRLIIIWMIFHVWNSSSGTFHPRIVAHIFHIVKLRVQAAFSQSGSRSDATRGAFSKKLTDRSVL